MNDMAGLPITRHMLTVAGGRIVHYRRLGSGPPAVLVHPSPTNSEYVIPLMRLLAPFCTCFAFDTPGFGSSDALPSEELSVPDLADALAEALDAIGMPAIPVFGTHTGAAIAVELARRHPARVLGVVADGLPALDADELSPLLEGYLIKIRPDVLGSHYTALWTRFRDQLIWFPWTSRQVSNLQRAEIASPMQIHPWLVTMLRAGNGYRPPYKAALTYGDEAIRAVAVMTQPALFMCKSSDMLFSHLDRLPPLRQGQSLMRLGSDPTAYEDAVRDAMTAYLGTDPPPVSQDALSRQAEEGLSPQAGTGFVGAPGKQLFIRRHLVASPDAPAGLVLLHDVPGTSARFKTMMRRLQRNVFAPDLPGCGESDPIADASPALDLFAEQVMAALAPVVPAPFELYGRGFGAALAARIARNYPERVSRLLLDAPVIVEDEAARLTMREQMAPPIVITAEGAHWYRTWLALRDSEVYWPWYETHTANLLRREGEFDAEALHDRTLEVMKQHETYGLLVPAALDSRLIEDAAKFSGEIVLRLSGIPVLDAVLSRIEAPWRVISAKADIFS